MVYAVVFFSFSCSVTEKYVYLHRFNGLSEANYRQFCTLLYLERNKMEIRGRIIQVLPQASGVSRSGNNWRKQEYLLETFDQYPRKVLFNFFNNAIDQYPLQVGEDIILSFDLESRSFVGRDGVERWSTDVRGWKAEKADAQMAAAPGFAPQPQMAAPGFAPQPQAAPAFTAPEPAVPQFPASEPAAAGSDDLPF